MGLRVGSWRPSIECDYEGSRARSARALDKVIRLGPLGRGRVAPEYWMGPSGGDCVKIRVKCKQNNRGQPRHRSPLSEGDWAAAACYSIDQMASYDDEFDDASVHPTQGRPALSGWILVIHWSDR